VVVPLDAVAGVDAESAMMPLSHLFRFLGGEFPLFREELEHAGAKQFGDLFPISSMQGVEGARANEGAVGNEDVQMGVVVQIVAEGLYGDDHTRLSGGGSESYPDDVAEAQPGGLVEAREEMAVVLEGFSEPLGEGDDDLPVGNFLGDLVADEFAELLDLLLMATGTEIALLATEGYQVVVAAMVAVQTGESAAQVAAGLEGVEGAPNFRAKTAFPFFEPGSVLVVKRVLVGGKALPKRRRPRTPRAV